VFILRGMRVNRAQVFIVRGLGLFGCGSVTGSGSQHGLHGFVPSAIAESVAEFAFHSGKGLQQELAEVAESGGAARPDAVLGEGAKYLAEGVIEVGSRGEFAGGSLEFDDGLAGAGTLTGLLRFDVLCRVVRAETRIVLGAGQAAVASIGKRKRQRVGLVDFGAVGAAGRVEEVGASVVVCAGVAAPAATGVSGEDSGLLSGES
jgi:hypothetical protein